MMKLDFPKAMLTVSLVMFISGFMILCDCPGWFGISALFAGLAAWKGKGRFRMWSLALVVMAVSVAAVQVLG